MNTWIKVEEKLPENGDRVLASNNAGEIFFATYTQSSTKWYRTPKDSPIEQHVTHWMPLPLPPGK